MFHTHSYKTLYDSMLFTKCLKFILPFLIGYELFLNMVVHRMWILNGTILIVLGWEVELIENRINYKPNKWSFKDNLLDFVNTNMNRWTYCTQIARRKFYHTVNFHIRKWSIFTIVIIALVLFAETIFFFSILFVVQSLHHCRALRTYVLSKRFWKESQLEWNVMSLRVHANECNGKRIDRQLNA